MITPSTVKVGTKLRFRDPARARSMGSKCREVRVSNIMPSTLWWTDRENGKPTDFVGWEIADEVFEIVSPVTYEELELALRQIMDVAADYTVALPVPAMRMYDIARNTLMRMTP